MREYSGVTADSVNNIIDSAGIVYFNVDVESIRTGDVASALTGATLFGATDGGNSFNPGRTMRQIEADGLLGPTKGFQRRGEVAPVLTVNGLEITAGNVIKAIAGATGAALTGGGMGQEITGGEVKPESYLDNVALVTYNQDASGEITPIAIFVVENALALDAPEFASADADEMVLSVDFAGHFDPAKPGEEPWRIFHRDAIAG